MEQKWTGNFDCASCGRKRLIAAEFSTKMMERYQKQPTINLRCKQCVDAQAQAERSAACARQAATVMSDERHMCSACKQTLPASRFTRAQLSKGSEKQRCHECVASLEVLSPDAHGQRKLDNAKHLLRQAEASDSVSARLVAATQLAALEAQQVTGIKPVILGRGRGRNHSRGHGRGS